MIINILLKRANNIRRILTIQRLDAIALGGVRKITVATAAAAKDSRSRMNYGRQSLLGATMVSKQLLAPRSRQRAPSCRHRVAVVVSKDVAERSARKRPLGAAR